MASPTQIFLLRWEWQVPDTALLWLAMHEQDASWLEQILVRGCTGYTFDGDDEHTVVEGIDVRDETAWVPLEPRTRTTNELRLRLEGGATMTFACTAVSRLSEQP